MNPDETPAEPALPPAPVPTEAAPLEIPAAPTPEPEAPAGDPLAADAPPPAPEAEAPAPAPTPEPTAPPAAPEPEAPAPDELAPATPPAPEAEAPAPVELAPLIRPGTADSDTREFGGPGTGWSLRFQQGAKELGRNGATTEEVLDALIEHISFFQQGKYACEENAQVIKLLGDAKAVIAKRAADRAARGVLGRSAK